MTKTLLPRTGGDVYSADTDLWPGRIGHNEIRQAYEASMAVWSQGLAASRPAPGLGGRFYYATDSKRLYWDNGSAWDEISPVGGGGSPTSVDIGDAAVEGTSRIAARADHQHPFPAPSTAPGAIAYAGTGTIGTATTPARADHSHTLPQLPFATSPPGINVWGTASAAGSSTAVARGDHTHALDLSAYHAIKTYTPEWKSVNPNEVQPGGGTIVGRYVKLGQWVHVEVHIFFESGVQGGRDNLYVTLPVEPIGGIPEQSIPCKLWSPTTGTWQGQVVFNPTTLVAFPLFPISAGDGRQVNWRQNAPGVTDGQQGYPRPVAGANVIEPGGRFFMAGAYLAAS